MRRRNIAQWVSRTTHCDGSDQLLVREWIRDIDFLLHESGNKGVLQVVVESISSSLRAETERYLIQRVTRDGIDRFDVPWADLKKHIIQLFLSSDEKEWARSQLDKITQGSFEM